MLHCLYGRTRRITQAMRQSVGFGVLSRAAKAVEERGDGVRRAEQHLLVIGDDFLYGV
jgi:hypothetical protein